MQPTHIICHYAEIGLKGKNRRYFEDKLIENIKSSLSANCPESTEFVKRLYGRFLIELTPEGRKSVDKLTNVLNDIMGLAYFVFAVETESKMELFNKCALELLSDQEFSTFRITTRRSNKYFPYSSQNINEEVGTCIVDNLNKKVKLKNPELTCYIDVLEKSTFIYTQKIRGSGGLPNGVSGKVVVMLSGGIDSPVASYYAMKRGANVIFIHFHSVPYTNRASIEKVREMVEVLNRFQPRAKLILVELAPIQKMIMANSDPKYRIVLYRRFMFRIAETIARRAKAHAIFTGESLGQVASQTLQNMDVIEEVTKIPILRPLIGFDKQEIINKAIEIGTYDISIQPDQDCCSLFVPKHPATKSRLKDVLANEEQLSVNDLVKTAINSAEMEIISL